MTGPSAEARAASAAIRSAAAAVLRSLASGEHSLSDLLTSDELEGKRVLIARAPVQRVLRAVPGIGPDAIMRICRQSDIHRLEQIGWLSPARRRQLVDDVAQVVDLDSYRGRGPRKAAS